MSKVFIFVVPNSISNYLKFKALTVIPWLVNPTMAGSYNILDCTCM